MRRTNLKLVSPWIDYYRKLDALFAPDPNVMVAYDEDGSTHTITLYVDGERKAAALGTLLKNEVRFGEVVLTIKVVPSNNVENKYFTLLKDAFDGNDAVRETVSVDDPVGGKHDFVIFKPEVVQYPNDDISDFYGLRSTLYQELAKEVIDIPEEGDAIHFCTGDKRCDFIEMS